MYKQSILFVKNFIFGMHLVKIMIG